MRTKLLAAFAIGAMLLAGCATTPNVATPKDIVNQSCTTDPTSSLNTFVGSAIEDAAGAGYTVVVKAAYQGEQAQRIGKTLGSGTLVFDTLVLLDAKDQTDREADNYMVIISAKGCVLGHAFMDRGQVDDAVKGMSGNVSQMALKKYTDWN